MIGLLPLITGWMTFAERKIGYGDFVFICTAATALATTVFADYHLLVFVAPLVLARGWTVRAACLLLLAPKGYWLIVDNLTVQVALNPMIMLCATALILGRAALLGHDRNGAGAELPSIAAVDPIFHGEGVRAGR
jgi:hypothetical protein